MPKTNTSADASDALLGASFVVYIIGTMPRVIPGGHGTGGDLFLTQGEAITVGEPDASAVAAAKGVPIQWVTKDFALDLIDAGVCAPAYSTGTPIRKSDIPDDALPVPPEVTAAGASIAANIASSNAANAPAVPPTPPVPVAPPTEAVTPPAAPAAPTLPPSENAPEKTEQ